jgi:hypothetical protein
MQVYRRRNKSWVQWSAHDALVLKWVAIQVEEQLPRNTHCHHLRGHGGVNGSTQSVASAWQSGEWRYVYRTDIRGYYRHILKHQVSGQLHWHIEDAIAGACACNGSITALKMVAKYVPQKKVFVAAAH